MTATQEWAGMVIDGTSRDPQFDFPDAVGYFRPLSREDFENAWGREDEDIPTEIDPRWLWVEWWISPTEEGSRVDTVGWREGDAVFVPKDATQGLLEYSPEGPRGSWMLAERPHAIVLNWPEEDGKYTLAVLG